MHDDDKGHSIVSGHGFHETGNGDKATGGCADAHNKKWQLAGRVARGCWRESQNGAFVVVHGLNRFWPGKALIMIEIALIPLIRAGASASCMQHNWTMDGAVNVHGLRR